MFLGKRNNQREKKEAKLRQNTEENKEKGDRKVKVKKNSGGKKGGKYFIV